MSTRTIHLVATAVLLVAVVIPATAASAAGDSIATWNDIAVKASAVVAKRTQAVSTIEVTIVQAAVYDAVNAIDAGRYQAYASAPQAPADASIDAAVATAAHDVLVWLYPFQAGTLDAFLTDSLAAIADGPEKDAGIATGSAAASAVITLRTNDGRDDVSATVTPSQVPGEWRPTPPAYATAQTPWAAKVKPFTMTSPSQFRPDAPPSLTSAAYTDSFNETARRGAFVGSIRSDDQTARALFWADNFTIQYNRYLRALAAAQQLSTPDTARLLAEVNMAAADAFIACMDGKYTYRFWRPVTAIPLAAADGNPNTTADAEWLPLLVTPNHPEYPSAHACGSGAVTDTLAAFFGTDHVRSTITSTVGNSGLTRTFDSFHDLYADVHDSRILGGLHFRFSMNAGRVIGAKVSRQLVKKYFVPVE